MLNERIEIAIAVQQSDFLFDATRRDQCVDRFTNRDAESPELAEVSRHLNGDFFADERDHRQGSQ